MKIFGKTSSTYRSTRRYMESSGDLLNDIERAVSKRGHEIWIQLGAKTEGKKSRDNMVFFCINSEHADDHPSLSVSNETGLGFCFGCGAKFNVITMAKELHHNDYMRRLLMALNLDRQYPQFYRK